MRAKQRRPRWASVGGVGERPRLAKEALAAELGRRMQEETTSELDGRLQVWVLEVASSVLGPEATTRFSARGGRSGRRTETTWTMLLLRRDLWRDQTQDQPG